MSYTITADIVSSSADKNSPLKLILSENPVKWTYSEEDKYNFTLYKNGEYWDEISDFWALENILRDFLNGDNNPFEYAYIKPLIKIDENFVWDEDESVKWNRQRTEEYNRLVQSISKLNDKARKEARERFKECVKRSIRDFFKNESFNIGDGEIYLIMKEITDYDGYYDYVERVENLCDLYANLLKKRES